MILPLILMTSLAAPPATACANLVSLQLAGATVTAAELAPAGPPSGARGGRGQANAQTPPLPAHCRVTVLSKPSADSNISIEMWLPVENWNGKFQAIGNGGWGGAIQGINATGMANMQTALRAGYATAGTDTGHKGADGPNGAFALNHPEKVIDFGYRAIHEMTVQAKAIIKAFYDRNPKYSYFNGCSTGGRQGLMEAQRYPEDFDGIVAGAPITNQIDLHAAELLRTIDIYKNPAGFLTPAKQVTLARAVLNACDEIDRVKDNLISRPLQCKFEPSTLLCKGPDSDECLTAPQVEAVKRIYMDTKDSKGQTLSPGFALGGEAGYAVLRGGAAPGAILVDTFRYLAHQDATWNWRTFDLEKDVALAVKNAGFINATDPDLSKFKSHGGKLLLYHGWYDQLVPPANTINYYETVLAKMGRNQSSWLRVFMVPGMRHCGNGPGAGEFDAMAAIETWREKGAAPAQIIGRNTAEKFKRPLCPYPQVAIYRGTEKPIVVARGTADDVHIQEEVLDDPTDRGNFVCRAP